MITCSGLRVGVKTKGRYQQILTGGMQNTPASNPLLDSEAAQSERLTFENVSCSIKLVGLAGPCISIGNRYRYESYHCCIIISYGIWVSVEYKFKTLNCIGWFIRAGPWSLLSQSLIWFLNLMHLRSFKYYISI